MSFEIRQGDVLERLREMEDNSVNCVCTSPPYWGLRDYGTGKWSGGNPDMSDCTHESTRGTQGSSGQRADREHTQKVIFTDQCGKCGAIRVDKQIGLEKTPEQFIERLVEVFREVRRVLRDDGVCWVNIGDSYSSQPGQRKQGVQRNDMAGWKQQTNAGCLTIGSRSVPNLKPKDLVGVPWMLAFALRADGWYLRSEIIWHKVNPMPESVRDRPTKAHEQISLFSKSPKYWYDCDAIKERAGDDTHARYARGISDSHKFSNGGPGGQTIARSFEHMANRHLPGNKTHKGTTAYENGDERHRTKAGLVDYATKVRERAAGVNPKCAEPGSGIKQNSSFSAAVKDIVEFRNKRSVWSMASMPTPEAHFATFPLELPETCILAGCPVDGLVLDPFAGAGTTGLAALKHGRNFLGIELNPEYVKISQSRLAQRMPLFA